MPIDSNFTTSGLGQANATSGSQAAMTKLGADYDSFLTLLTAQIVNQNPLEPMDSTAFVSQLAQLTQVEQSIVANSSLEEISSRLAASSAVSDVLLIGRNVTLPTDTIELRDGAATYSYELSKDAANVRAVIRHEDGTILREIAGLPAASGATNTFTWDGRDSQGLPVPDGNFTVEIAARNAADEPVMSNGFATSRVEQLMFIAGQSMLSLSNGTKAPSASIVAVD